MTLLICLVPWWRGWGKKSGSSGTPGGLPNMAVSEWSYQLRPPRVNVPKENTEAGRLLRSNFGHPSMSPYRVRLANQVSRAGLDSGRGKLDCLAVGEEKTVSIFNWSPPLLLGFCL